MAGFGLSSVPENGRGQTLVCSVLIHPRFSPCVWCWWREGGREGVIVGTREEKGRDTNGME